MFKPLKRTALSVGRVLGVDALLAASRWRSERVLILCYHGISLQDEHLWDGELYMPPEMFARRLELLKKHRCSVLPLDEALSRIDKGNLPPRSVVLTFDDGMFDFHRQAMPLLKAFGFPATVYLTSFYAAYNRPVFYLACSYLLWKFRAEHRSRTLSEIAAWIQDAQPSAEEQHARLVQLASGLGTDIGEMTSRRILHLMTPAELLDAVHQGFSIQLHTHRHRTPLKEDLFTCEIEQNRKLIRDWTGQTARHFCYPNGTVHPEFLPWLTNLGIASATTCVPGLASRIDNRLLLPRLVDHTGLSENEFTSWLSGSGDRLRSLRTVKMIKALSPQLSAI